MQDIQSDLEEIKENNFSITDKKISYIEKEINLIKERNSDNNVKMMNAINDCNAIFKSFVEDIGRINTKLNSEMEEIKNQIKATEVNKKEEKENVTNLIKNVEMNTEKKIREDSEIKLNMIKSEFEEINKEISEKIKLREEK